MTMATLLDGNALSKRLNAELAVRAAGLVRRPGLAVVLVGADPASQVYVRKKGEVAEQLGFAHWQIDLPADTTQAALCAEVDRLNADPRVDGILVQMPLPKGLDANAVLDRIDPAKDVDGFTAVNTGLLAGGRPNLVPCTPLGCMKLLASGGIDPAGKEAVVVGRSNIVGRPMARLLELANATVTVCHTKTHDLPAHVARAEILVVAVGRIDAVPGAWIRPGAAVLDVGMNRKPDGKLTGDVEFAVAVERAGAITPVPRGVGPMTIAMLMENTFQAALRRQ